MRSGGSTNAGLTLSRFLTSIPSFVNTPISSIPAHLNHSKGGSADVFSQNGLIPERSFKLDRI